jgi:hypothetical protein
VPAGKLPRDVRGGIFIRRNDLTLQEKVDLIDAAYAEGFKDGLTAYAINKDGGQEVGAIGKKLKDAIANMKSTWNYCFPNHLL